MASIGIMVATVFLLSVTGSSAKGMMRRTQQQTPMKTQDTNETSLQGHAAQKVVAENVHKNSVYMQVDASGAAHGWQSAAKETKEHIYMEMDSSAYMRKTADTTPPQEETLQSYGLQKITRFKTLVHHVRSNPALINELASSAGIETLGWTADEMHTAAHSVHKKVIVDRAQSLLETKANAHTQIEQLLDGLNRMKQDAQEVASNASAAVQSLNQQIDAMLKRLDVIQNISKSALRRNRSDFQTHQQFDDIHEELDALSNEIRLVGGEVTLLRNRIHEHRVDRDLHELRDTFSLQGQDNSSDGSLARDLLAKRYSSDPYNVPWRDMQTGLTKSVKKYGMRGSTQRTIAGLGKSTATLLTKMAMQGGQITGADMFGFMESTVPAMMFLANPLLGAVVGMAFTVIKGVFFPGPAFLTEQSLEVELRKFEKMVLEKIEELIRRYDLEGHYVSVGEGLQDLLEELYWMTQMLCNDKARCEDENPQPLSQIDQQTQLTYQLMIQHHLSMMKRGVFHTECWDLLSPPAASTTTTTTSSGSPLMGCNEYRVVGAGFLLEFQFAATHINVLLEICRLQPAYCGTVLGRVRHLGLKYMTLIGDSVRVFGDKRLDMVNKLVIEQKGDDCLLRDGFDRKLQRRTINVEEFWGRPVSEIEIGNSLMGGADSGDLPWGGTAPILIKRCTCWWPCANRYVEQDGRHETNIDDQLDEYAATVQEMYTAFEKLPVTGISQSGSSACVNSWRVTGGCSEARGCVTSGNWPNNYQNGEECRMVPVCECSCKVKAHDGEFNTERGYDILRVENTRMSFSGTRNDVEFDPQGQTLTWSSDGSVTNKGFKICLI